jgi:hypothetical protein
LESPEGQEARRAIIVPFCVPCRAHRGPSPLGEVRAEAQCGRIGLLKELGKFSDGEASLSDDGAQSPALEISAGMYRYSHLAGRIG